MPGTALLEGTLLGQEEAMSERCERNTSCAACERQRECSSQQREEHERWLLERSLSQICHRFMVISGKGGVGKSTLSANLAIALAMEGYEVGLLDADVHGPNIPKMLGLEEERLVGSASGNIAPAMLLPNLKVVSMAFLLPNRDSPVIWRGPLKHSAFRQFLSEVEWGKLDFLLVDLPPGTGDEPLSIAHLLGRVDGSIVVTTPQEVALLDSRKAVNFSRQLQVPVIGVVENMSGFVCPHCGRAVEIFKSGGGERAARELGVPFLGRVPLDPRVVSCCDEGRPFIEAFPQSEAAKAFRQIASRCLEFVGEKTGAVRGSREVGEVLRRQS